MAAQPGIINATDFKLYLDNTGSNSKPLAHSTSVSLTVSAEMMDATTKDSAGWDEFIPGRKSWSASGDFFYNQSPIGGNHNISTLWAAFVNKTSLGVIFRLGTQDDGDSYYSGSAFIESLDVSAGVEENVSVSISLKGSGAITKLIVGGE